MNTKKHDYYAEDKLKIEKMWPAYRFEKLIGEGGQGRVYQVSDGYQKLAVKHIVIRLPDNISSNYEDENKYLEGQISNYKKVLDLLEPLKWIPTIASFREYRVQRNIKSADIYIVMDLMETLRDYIRKNGFTERDLQRLGIDIASALEAVHAHGLLHRDVTPGNIFYYEGYFKLGDFSAADIAGGHHNGTLVVNTRTSSPEVILNKTFDFRSDIYSLGMTLYCIADESNRVSLEDRLLENIPPLNNLSSEDLCEAILKACKFKPENRYQSASEFKNQLQRISIEKDVVICPKESASLPEESTLGLAPIGIDEIEKGFEYDKTIFLMGEKEPSYIDFHKAAPIQDKKYIVKKKRSYKHLSTWLFSTCMISIIPTIFYLMCVLFLADAHAKPSMFLHEFIFLSVVLLTTAIRTVFWGKAKEKHGKILFPIGAFAIIADIAAFALFSLIIISEMMEMVYFKEDLYKLSVIMCMTSFCLGFIAEIMEDFAE